jgi:DDE superfamily endonuclease
MLPGVRVPASFEALLAPLRVCFTAPTFITFTMMVTGALAQTGQVTVCGMLVGAGVAGRWHHSRGHRFFASARWCPDAVGVLLADMIVARLLPAGAPITVIIDDTLFRRSGPNVHAAAWLYDGAAGNRRAGKATDAATVAWGNNWVVAGLLVTLPFTTTPTCLPVLARLWQPGNNGRRHGNRTRAASQGDSKQHLARDLIEILGWRYPNHHVHIVFDAAYGCRQLRGLPPNVTLTTRPPTDAALWHRPPPRPTGTRGRPRTKGTKMPRLAVTARTTTHWTTATVTRYHTRTTIHVHEQPCLWYDVWLTQPTRLILIRETTSTRAYDIALITTDPHTPLTEIIERYAARWAIEVCFHEAKQTYHIGQARNRTYQAVHRTVPFGLLTITLTTIWYTTTGHDPTDITDRRARQPWYRTKTQPSASDMLAKLRRVVIAEQFRPEPLRPPTPAEITAVHQAWARAGT